MKLSVSIRNATEQQAAKIRDLGINYIRLRISKYNPDQDPDDDPRILPIEWSSAPVDGNPFERTVYIRELELLCKEETTGVYSSDNRYLFDLISRYEKMEIVQEDDVDYDPDIQMVITAVYLGWPVQRHTGEEVISYETGKISYETGKISYETGKISYETGEKI